MRIRNDGRSRTEIMRAIYFLFAVKNFQCLFEMISVSFYSCNLCLCEFLYRICWMKMIQIFEMIETRHLNTSNYTTVIGEVHLLNVINELLLFLSISFIFHIGIHGRKNKNCVTKTLFTNFARRNCFTKYGRICSLFLR